MCHRFDPQLLDHLLHSGEIALPLKVDFTTEKFETRSQDRKVWQVGK